MTLDDSNRAEVRAFLRTWYGVLRILSPSGVVEIHSWDQAVLDGQL